MNKSNKSHEVEDKFHYRKFRFWPVYFLALLRTFYFSIYSLALPNYLIFDKEISASLVGIIISSHSIAYIGGPLIGEKISRSIGIKNAVSLSCILSTIFLIIQILLPIPSVLIILRLLDGIALGLFWSNLQIELCNWQGNSFSPNHIDHYFKTYGISWNLGLLLGFLFGGFIVFFLGDDLMALSFSFFICLLMIPCSFYLERPNTNFFLYNNREVVLLSGKYPGIAGLTPISEAFEKSLKEQDNKVNNGSLNISSPPSPPNNNENTGDNNENSFLFYPIQLCFLMVLCFSLSKGVLNFNIPLTIEKIGLESFWVYILYFVIQITQIAAIKYFSDKEHNQLFWLSIISLGVFILICIILLHGVSFMVFFILYSITGIIFGVVYSLFTKIMLAHTTKTKSTRFANLYEVFMGMGFGIAPFVGGFIAEINLNLNFIISLFISCVVIAINIIVVKNKKNKDTRA